MHPRALVQIPTALRCAAAREKDRALLCGAWAQSRCRCSAGPINAHAGGRAVVAQSSKLPGLTVHDLMLIPISACGTFDSLTLPSSMLRRALALLQDEDRTRLKYRTCATSASAT